MLKKEIHAVIAAADVPQIKKFSRTVGLVLVVLGAFLFWKEFRLAPVIGTVGLLLLLSGWIVPSALRPLYLAWMALAVTLGYFMSRVILMLLFTIVFVPAGLAIRLLRKDPLKQKRDPGSSSYWIPRDPKYNDPQMAEKQF